MDDEEAPVEEQPSEVGTEEELEGFMKGYGEDDAATECAECGKAVRTEKKVLKAINGEEYTFCSKDCAQEFEESVKEE